MRLYTTPKSAPKGAADLSLQLGGVIAYTGLSESQCLVPGVTEALIHAQAARALGPDQKYRVIHTPPSGESDGVGYWAWKYDP